MSIYTWVVVLAAVLGFAALRGLLWVERRLREIAALETELVQSRWDLLVARDRIDVLKGEIAELRADILQMIEGDLVEDNPRPDAGDIDPWEDPPF